MRTHNMCYHEEIKKNINLFNALSAAMLSHCLIILMRLHDFGEINVTNNVTIHRNTYMYK